jgi:large subunit ribosomal protein L21
VYAIIEDGSRQLRVRKDERIRVDVRDFEEGAKVVVFDRVLMIGDEAVSGSAKIGQPWVEGARVTARINGEVLGDKIVVMKAKRRKGYRLKQGHRQAHLDVTIEAIEG